MEERQRRRKEPKSKKRKRWKKIKRGLESISRISISKPCQLGISGIKVAPSD